MLPVTTTINSYFLKVISHSRVILDLTPSYLFKPAWIVLELLQASQAGFVIAEPLPGGGPWMPLKGSTQGRILTTLYLTRGGFLFLFF